MVYGTSNGFQNDIGNYFDPNPYTGSSGTDSLRQPPVNILNGDGCQQFSYNLYSTYSPPQVDRIWGVWGSCYNILKAIFYLLNVYGAFPKIALAPGTWSRFRCPN